MSLFIILTCLQHYLLQNCRAHQMPGLFFLKFWPVQLRIIMAFCVLLNATLPFLLVLFSALHLHNSQIIFSRDVVRKVVKFYLQGYYRYDSCVTGCKNYSLHKIRWKLLVELGHLENILIIFTPLFAIILELIQAHPAQPFSEVNLRVNLTVPSLQRNFFRIKFVLPYLSSS